MGLYENITV